MKAVILDGFALREGDMDWSPIEKMTDSLTIYPRTVPDQIIERLQDAELAIVNKANINEDVLAACPKLKWVGVTATGVDSLDIAACRRHNVDVANVPAYSTDSVAQHTFALLLSLCHSCAPYDTAIREGYWQIDVPQGAIPFPLMELAGKTMGLIGYGDIGKRVAAIGSALGLRILCHTRTVREEYHAHPVQFVSAEEIWAQSDIISLHCPSTPETRGILNKNSLSQCKKGVYIINTARGLLVDEQAMADALQCGQVGAFAADVVSTEPMREDNPLRNAPRVLLTPHIAWATPEALARLAQTVADNLASFLAGKPQNIVN